MIIIKDINGNVLYECDSKDLRECVLEAVKSMADLHGADLHGADLHGADLHEAYLHEANLHGANLRWADLHWANLHEADLHGADLHGADLHGADIRRADLHEADLHEADLHGAYIRWADLRDADLRGAYIRWADLNGADLRGTKNIPYVPLACPSDGEFTGWKKVNNKLVKLLIPATARRSSANTNKCRCDMAIVLAVTSLDEKEMFDEVVNCSYAKLTYKVGEEVLPDSYDDNRWEECSNGIHFFINKQDAINY